MHVGAQALLLAPAGLCAPGPLHTRSGASQVRACPWPPFFSHVPQHPYWSGFSNICKSTRLKFVFSLSVKLRIFHYYIFGNLNVFPSTFLGLIILTSRSGRWQDRITYPSASESGCPEPRVLSVWSVFSPVTPLRRALGKWLCLSTHWRVYGCTFRTCQVSQEKPDTERLC